MRTARARISGEHRFDVMLFFIALILAQVEGLRQSRGGSLSMLTMLPSALVPVTARLSVTVGCNTLPSQRRNATGTRAALQHLAQDRRGVTAPRADRSNGIKRPFSEA